MAFRRDDMATVMPYAQIKDWQALKPKKDAIGIAKISGIGVVSVRGSTSGDLKFADQRKNIADNPLVMALC